MKVSDAIKLLKQYPKDAEIFMVKDWEDMEDGCLNDLYRLIDIIGQVRVVDDGMDWKDETEVLLEFDNEKAKAI